MGVAMDTTYTRSQCDICGRELSITQIRFKIVLVLGVLYAVCDHCYVAHRKEE